LNDARNFTAEGAEDAEKSLFFLFSAISAVSAVSIAFGREIAMEGRLKVFAGQSNPALAREICSYLDVALGNVTFTQFSNENIKVKIEENVRETDVFVVQTSCSPVSDHLMELLIMIDALKYASAARITAVLPYYPYVRSDKKDEPRISITARLVADLLETAGASRVLTMNLHAEQIIGFSRIPVDQLLAIPIICDYFSKKDLSNFVAVAPDVGRAKTTEHYARRLDLPMAILDKRRIGDDEHAVIRHVIGDVEGKDVMLLDDEILTGGSILEGIRALKERGARRVLAGCVHGVLSGNAVPDIEASPIEELVVTNTIPLKRESSKVTVLSVARLFADAIRAIHEGSSVSTLFD
jgi:ribose-phosphate pyrophosphokinase